MKRKSKAGNFIIYTQTFEYCVQNVGYRANDDAIKYEKVEPAMRIDIFDATVFAAMQMLKNMQKSQTATKWLKGGE